MNWPSLPQRLHSSLKALCCLAHAERPIHAQQVGACAGLAPAQTAKLLQLLAWGGFVQSRRGSNGGFWLGVPAEGIRIGDVVEFFYPERGRKKQDDIVSKALTKISAKCSEQFERMTIADLLQGQACPFENGCYCRRGERCKSE